MNQILIRSDESRGHILSVMYGLEIGQKAYFNMFQDGGAAIERKSQELYVLYSIPLYGGKESMEMVGNGDDIKAMVDMALSWT